MSRNAVSIFRSACVIARELVNEFTARLSADESRGGHFLPVDHIDPVCISKGVHALQHVAIP